VRRSSARAFACAVTLALLSLSAPIRASVEEFSTFGIAPQERDDESLFDHFLTRMPRAWRDEWSRAPGGFRTSQGCLTSGRWFVDTDFKARASLGKQAWLGVALRESESDVLDFRHLDLSFHFPQSVGALFAAYRPDPVKAAQDFAIGWEAGADTGAVHFSATWTIEDIFNHFAGFRQAQVDDRMEPYERRPYEPALALAVRRPDWRLELGGKWLTPSRQKISDIASQQLLFERELWGVAANAAAERRLGALTLEVRSDHRQAEGRERRLDRPLAPLAHYRRQWSVEAATRLDLARSRTGIEWRYLYQSRTEFAGRVPTAVYLQVDDRFFNLDLIREFAPWVSARVGGSYARLGVARANFTDYNYGTRSESRLYVGLAVRFGRVRIAGIEGVELDDEPYDVRFVHDKGFLQLQTTF